MGVASSVVPARLRWPYWPAHSGQHAKACLTPCLALSDSRHQARWANRLIADFAVRLPLVGARVPRSGWLRFRSHVICRPLGVLLCRTWRSLGGDPPGVGHSFFVPVPLAFLGKYPIDCAEGRMMVASTRRFLSGLFGPVKADHGVAHGKSTPA